MRSLMVVFMVLSCFLSVSRADGSLYGINEPVAPQVYSQVGDKPPAAEKKAADSTQSSADGANSDSEMANVQAIVQQSKAIQGGGASASLTGTSNNTAVPSSVSAIQSMVSRLNQTFLLYQQQNDQKVESNAEQVVMLQQQFSQLNKALKSLSVEQIKLQAMAAQLPASSHASVSDSSDVSLPEHTTALGHFVVTYLWLLMAIVMVALIIYVGKLTMDCRALKANQRDMNHQKGAEDEYDFMGSDDAIPAQLDLARTYIAMNDLNQARQVLLAIIKKGSLAQKKQAQMMLDRLSSGQA